MVDGMVRKFDYGVETFGPKRHRILFKVISIGCFTLLCVLTVLFLLIRYSNIPLFQSIRSIYIETAMTTMSHQYLATEIFSHNEIEEVMNSTLSSLQKNKIIDYVILPDTSETVSNAVYEEKIRKSQIEAIDISGTGYKGKLLIIHDPSRVKLAISSKFGEIGERLGDIVKRENAVGGINASGFIDVEGVGLGDTPTGIVIKNGKIIYDPKTEMNSIIGFNYKDQLVIGNYNNKELENLNLRDAIEFSPFLIINGEKQIGNGSTGGGGIQPRTAIAQTQDGKVLMLVIDGRQVHSLGATLKQVQDILYEYGAYNAASVDGGSSTSMWYKGEIQSKPCGPAGERLLPTAFIFK